MNTLVISGLKINHVNNIKVVQLFLNKFQLISKIRKIIIFTMK
jgi:hypothetical protein